MRELKFRAWMEEDKKMFQFDFRNASCHGTKSDANTFWPIMQFTGLKDGDGQEIYEGDLIKAELPEREDEEPTWNGGEVGSETFTKIAAKTIIGEVRINPKSGARLLVRPVVEHEPMRPHKKTERIRPARYLKIRKADKIIGNIHENPELLRPEAA